MSSKDTGNKPLKISLLIVPFLVTIVLDQFTKYWVRHNPSLQRLDIIEGVLEFSYTLNDGMALGINWLPTKVISIVAILATIAIMTYALFTWKSATNLYNFCISLVLGGAVGNIIDRIIIGKILGHGGILEGHVVDFIYFSLRIGNWPVFPYIFNVADIAISLAIIILLVFHRKAFVEDAKQETEPVSTQPTTPASDSHESPTV